MTIAGSIAKRRLGAEDAPLLHRLVESAWPHRWRHGLVAVLMLVVPAFLAGRVVEQGTHDYLVAERGLYARLADLQFGFQVKFRGATA